MCGKMREKPFISSFCWFLSVSFCTPRKGHATWRDFSRLVGWGRANLPDSLLPRKRRRPWGEAGSGRQLLEARGSSTSPALHPARGCWCFVNILALICCLGKWKMSTSRCLWINRSLRFTPLPSEQHSLKSIANFRAAVPFHSLGFPRLNSSWLASGGRGNDGERCQNPSLFLSCFNLRSSDASKTPFGLKTQRNATVGCSTDI